MLAITMTEDQLNLFVGPQRTEPEEKWHSLPFLAIDTETSGLQAKSDRVIEIAWARFEKGQIVHAFSQLLRIDRPLSNEIIELTGITDENLKGQPLFEDVADTMLAAMKGVAYITAYNARFDKKFIAEELTKCGKKMPIFRWIDPLILLKEIDKGKKGMTLTEATKRWGIPMNQAHRALADAIATGQLLGKLTSHLPDGGLPQLLDLQEHYRARQIKRFQASRWAKKKKPSDQA